MGVGRNDAKLSAEMKAAVVAAREDGMAPAEIVEHAAAGRFDGLGKFTIAESTIRRLVQFKRNRDRVTAGNGGSDHDDDTPEPDRLRAIAEATIARVEQLEKPTARDLSAAQQAQRVLDDADRRAARRSRPPATPASSKAPPLLELLARQADEAEQDPGRTDLEARRHDLSMRWVRAEVRRIRAEHPDWDQATRNKHYCGRPTRFDREWKLICGDDPAGKWRIPRDAETIGQLHDLLDREEAELAALEAQHSASPPREH